MTNITLEFVRDNFKNQSAVADGLKISKQAVSKWFSTGAIPLLRQYQIRELLNKDS